MRNLLLAGLSIFAFTGRVISEDGWKRGLEKNGITIETRSIPGSAYKEFRARMVVKAKLSKAISIMEDIPGYTGWMKDCKEARVLSKASATSGVIYSLQATPWPIAEREAPRLVSLPLHPLLTDADVADVIDATLDVAQSFSA